MSHRLGGEKLHAMKQRLADSFHIQACPFRVQEFRAPKHGPLPGEPRGLLRGKGVYISRRALVQPNGLNYPKSSRHTEAFSQSMRFWGFRV